MGKEVKLKVYLHGNFQHIHFFLAPIVTFCFFRSLISIEIHFSISELVYDKAVYFGKWLYFLSFLNLSRSFLSIKNR